MDPFVTAVARTISRWRMIGADETVVVAVSGGADSVALLASLLELGHSLSVAHYDHDWRGDESRRDAEFVAALCARLEVPLSLERRPSSQPSAKGGLEQNGRVLRYEFLHRVAAARGAARIATGHTRNDQAETVLLRLLRGSGVAGLSGIRPVRGDGVVRPLLEVGREDVLAYLERRRLDHVEDRSNLDPRFTRNRLRSDVLPVLRQFMPRLEERLAAVARSARGAALSERRVATKLLRRSIDAEGRLRLGELAELPEDVRQLVARAWLWRVRGGLRRLGAAHIEAVADSWRSGARVELPGGEAVLNEHGALRFVPQQDRETVEQPAATVELAAGQQVDFAARWRLTASPVEPREAEALPADLWHVVVDADVADAFVVRAWRHGDHLQPLGMSGHRKLSDVFIDAKVPRWRRSLLPVVESGGRILWVPGVVRSGDAALQAGTTRVIHLHASPQDPRLIRR